MATPGYGTNCPQISVTVPSANVSQNGFDESGGSSREAS